MYDEKPSRLFKTKPNSRRYKSKRNETVDGQFRKLDVNNRYSFEAFESRDLRLITSRCRTITIGFVPGLLCISPLLRSLKSSKNPDYANVVRLFESALIALFIEDLRSMPPMTLFPDYSVTYFWKYRHFALPNVIYAISLIHVFKCIPESTTVYQRPIDIDSIHEYVFNEEQSQSKQIRGEESQIPGSRTRIYVSRYLTLVNDFILLLYMFKHWNRLQEVAISEQIVARIRLIVDNIPGNEFILDFEDIYFILFPLRAKELSYSMRLFEAFNVNDIAAPAMQINSLVPTKPQMISVAFDFESFLNLSNVSLDSVFSTFGDRSSFAIHDEILQIDKLCLDSPIVNRNNWHNAGEKLYFASASI